MKRIVHAFIAMMMLLIAMPIQVSAEEYSEEYYRVYDYNNHLTDYQTQELDQLCLEILDEYYMDVTAVGLDNEILGADTLEEYGRYEYIRSSFGYGSDMSGVIFVWNTDTNEMDIVAFGKAETVMTEESEAEILDELQELDLEDAYSVFANFIVSTAEVYSENSTSEISGLIRPSGNTSSNQSTNEPSFSGEKPWWYPEDIESFEFYHDAGADRLVDAADIFTDSEEAELRSLLQETGSRYNKDVVIYTDSSSYGLSHDLLAADFYDFNGYGIGEDREGFILLICMDPDSRGYYITGTGPESMRLHTYSNAQRLDDGIYSYLVSGDYGDAAKEWVKGIDDLYRTGIAFAPEWYPDRTGSQQRTHNSEVTRVYDQENFLSTEEKAVLETRIAEMQEKYDVDFVVLTVDDDLLGMSEAEYLEAFYEGMGYGFHDTFDGYGLLLRTTYNYSEVQSFGMADVLNEQNRSRMETRIGIEGSTYDAADLWLDMQESFLRNGRVPHGSVYWTFRALFASIAGVLFGGISLGRAKKKMKAEQADPLAEQYISTANFGRIRSKYLTQSVTTRVIRSESSGGGGSSGGASYSSSYSGSSGSSHSGSGRGF